MTTPCNTRNYTRGSIKRMKFLIASSDWHCCFITPHNKRWKHCPMCVGIFRYLILCRTFRTVRYPWRYQKILYRLIPCPIARHEIWKDPIAICLELMVWDRGKLVSKLRCHKLLLQHKTGITSIKLICLCHPLGQWGWHWPTVLKMIAVKWCWACLNLIDCLVHFFLAESHGNLRSPLPLLMAAFRRSRLTSIVFSEAWTWTKWRYAKSNQSRPSNGYHGFSGVTSIDVHGSGSAYLETKLPLLLVGRANIVVWIRYWTQKMIKIQTIELLVVEVVVCLCCYILWILLVGLLKLMVNFAVFCSSMPWFEHSIAIGGSHMCT